MCNIPCRGISCPSRRRSHRYGADSQQGQRDKVHVVGLEAKSPKQFFGNFSFFFLTVNLFMSFHTVPQVRDHYIYLILKDLHFTNMPVQLGLPDKQVEMIPKIVTV